MSGRKIIEGLEEAVAMARAMPPTDAEVEAMAERLWEVYRQAAVGYAYEHIRWSRVVRSDIGRLTNVFRAMARAALEKRDDDSHN